MELVAKKPGLAVYGADARIPEINYVCKDHEEFKLGTLTVTPLHTPCHTKGHVCYFVVDPTTGERAVFTGDTLFVAGCGRFFEGDARDMYRNLFHVLARLPEDTWVFCGHEYTRANLKVRGIAVLNFCVMFPFASNTPNLLPLFFPPTSSLSPASSLSHSSSLLRLQFALSIDPQNQALLTKAAWCQDKIITVPSTIGQEMLYNPFLRVNEETLKMAVGKSDPVEVLQTLREMKNSYK